MSDRHYVHHEDEIALAKILKESKPWLERYGTAIIYAVAAVLAIAAVGVYVSRRPPANAAESERLLMASLASSASPEQYRDLADATPDSTLGALARVRQGELLLRDAVRDMFTDRKAGIEQLDDAANVFQRLLERKDLRDDLRERALAGMARVLDTQCDGKTESADAAVAAWDLLLKEFPDSKMFSEIAASRKKNLVLESTKLTNAWFHEQNPAPGDDLQLPQDGPGAVPGIPGLSLPHLNIPDIPSPPTGTPAGEPAAGGTTPPETPDAPSATETPAETPAAPAEQTPSETPATPAEPAGETPSAPAAEETPAPAETTPEHPAEGTPAPKKSGE